MLLLGRGPFTQVAEDSFLRISIIVAVVAVIYANSLAGQWTFDDKVVIVDNPLMRSPLSALLSHDFWGVPLDGSRWTHKSWRPLTTLSFRLQYFVGGLEPFGVICISNFPMTLASICFGQTFRTILI